MKIESITIDKELIIPINPSTIGLNCLYFDVVTQKLLVEPLMGVIDKGDTNYSTYIIGTSDSIGNLIKKYVSVAHIFGATTKGFLGELLIVKCVF